MSKERKVFRDLRKRVFEKIDIPMGLSSVVKVSCDDGTGDIKIENKNSLPEDAALIAAAPDLLEALKEAHGFIRNITDENGFTVPHDIRMRPDKLWSMMNAAIKKAETV